MPRIKSPKRVKKNRSPQKKVKRVTKNRALTKKAKSLSERKSKKRKKATKIPKSRRKTKGTRKKKIVLAELKKLESPILEPKKEHEWESWQTFNPGVILLENKVHIIYRAIGKDGISRLGYALSPDGFHIQERLPYPIYEHSPNKVSPFYYTYTLGSGYSLGGAEDPRLVRVNEEDKIYMTYTALDGGIRVALTSIKIKNFLNKKWRWKPPQLISPPGQVHKNWVIFPEKIKGKYAILHSLSPEISIAYRDSLDFKEGEYIKSYYNGNYTEKDGWECYVRGAGAPPIKTRLGWLLFYHGLHKKDPGKYKVGAIILDLKNPETVLYRSKEPILEPEKEYENNGFKPGVVYVSGAVIKDQKLLIYYGSSDSYISCAWTELENFLDAIIKQIKPKLKKTLLKKKKNDN